MRVNRNLGRASLLLGLLFFAITVGMAKIQVEVNGKTLVTSVAPMTVNGRTMVPLRSIFEALDAQVNWDAASKMITATKDNTTVKLGIGQKLATVNDETVILDVPAMIVNGSTLVPVRFVSEALGAEVKWYEATQMVSIFTDQKYSSDVVVIPAGVVIPVTLDTPLNSATSNKGDQVNVTIRSTKEGDAEFPLGTQLVGIIADVQRKGTNTPGMIDLAFQQAQMPDGRNANIIGSLISLDNKTVTQSPDGRIIAINKKTNERLKFIAIGTGAGLVIGQLLKKNLIVGGLLGAAAGYLYNEFGRDHVKSLDVAVPAGTEFGVRLDHELVYNASQAYVLARAEYLKQASVNAP